MGVFVSRMPAQFPECRTRTRRVLRPLGRDLEGILGLVYTLLKLSEHAPESRRSSGKRCIPRRRAALDPRGGVVVVDVNDVHLTPQFRTSGRRTGFRSTRWRRTAEESILRSKIRPVSHWSTGMGAPSGGDAAKSIPKPTPQTHLACGVDPAIRHYDAIHLRTLFVSRGVERAVVLLRSDVSGVGVQHRPSSSSGPCDPNTCTSRRACPRRWGRGRCRRCRLRSASDCPWTHRFETSEQDHPGSQGQGRSAMLFSQPTAASANGKRNGERRRGPIRTSLPR